MEVIDILLKNNFKVLLRPHFRIFQETPNLIDEINKKFLNHKNFRLEEGVISKEDFHSSKCLISDWSGISMEYAFVFERPVVYIDVPQKIMNDEMEKIPLTPLEVSIREKIGYVINPKNLAPLNPKEDLNNTTKGNPNFCEGFPIKLANK